MSQTGIRAVAAMLSGADQPSIASQKVRETAEHVARLSCPAIAMICYDPASRRYGGDMPQIFDAIFENDVIRPLAPLQLSDGTKLRVTIEEVREVHPLLKYCGTL